MALSMLRKRISVQSLTVEIVKKLVLSRNPIPFPLQFASASFSFLNIALSWIAVVNQFYGADILMEYVIRGNAAVLKCSIPSFVADFVRVESWIDEEGTELRASENYGITKK